MDDRRPVPSPAAVVVVVVVVAAVENIDDAHLQQTIVMEGRHRREDARVDGIPAVVEEADVDV